MQVIPYTRISNRVCSHCRKSLQELIMPPTHTGMSLHYIQGCPSTTPASILILLIHQRTRYQSEHTISIHHNPYIKTTQNHRKSKSITFTERSPEGWLQEFHKRCKTLKTAFRKTLAKMQHRKIYLNRVFALRQ